MKINKKVTGATAGVAATIIMATTALAPDTVELEGRYQAVPTNPYNAEISFEVPEEFKPDIVALKMNDVEVSKTLLPQGTITTHPVTISRPDLLSLDMYVRGEKAATATFDDDGTLDIVANKKYVNTEESKVESDEE